MTFSIVKFVPMVESFGETSSRWASGLWSTTRWVSGCFHWAKLVEFLKIFNSMRFVRLLDILMII